MMRSRPLQRTVVFLAVLFVIGLLYVSFPGSSRLPSGESAFADGLWQKRWEEHEEQLAMLKMKQAEILKLLQKLEEERSAAAAAAAAAHTAQENNVKLTMVATQKATRIAVLMIACNRPDALRRSLKRLLELRPSAEKFPIVVSLDCAHQPTEGVAKEFGDRITLVKQPDQSQPVIDGPATKRAMLSGYYKISRHYRWALGQVFDEMKFDTAIIIEDDLDIAVDFFEMMEGTEPLLRSDPTLWCVSAWNDNGKGHFIYPEKADLLYRTDFFPGLGWMIKKSIWDELRDKWPKSFWDDWMRNPEQRKGRACIRPEVSRTFTFGNIGVSRGQFWKQHLQFIHLNDKKVDFTKLDLSYLQMSTYDKIFRDAVYSAPLKSFVDLAAGGQGPSRVEYQNNVEFKRLAKQFQIMDDLRAGVPRMAYQGIVPFVYNNQRVFLAPPPNWAGYVPDKK